jgi:hypothetical protein
MYLRKETAPGETRPDRKCSSSSDDDLHNGIDASAVSFPHGPEARLTADVPHLDGHVALGDFPHVEAHRGDHVFAELARLKAEKARCVKKRGGCRTRRILTYRDHVDEGGFS